MQTIDTIRELLDEMPILAQISKDLPFPYITIISRKIKEFNAYLEEIHTEEIDIKNGKNCNIDFLINPNKYEENPETIKENFFGEIVEANTYNSEKKEINFLDELAKKHTNKKNLKSKH